MSAGGKEKSCHNPSFQYLTFLEVLDVHCFVVPTDAPKGLCITNYPNG